MSLQATRLHLATMLEEMPVHGFLVTYPGGAVLVDTGVGGPRQVLADHRVMKDTGYVLKLRDNATG
jgi:hypothetical protein